MYLHRAVLLMRATELLLRGLAGLNENVDVGLDFVDFLGLDSKDLVLLGQGV